MPVTLEASAAAEGPPLAEEIDRHAIGGRVGQGDPAERPGPVVGLITEESTALA
ncbi:hypothetical protein ACRAWD_30855 [Caulobacter segnis]